MVERIRAGLEALGIPSPGAAATLSRYGELLIEKNKRLPSRTRWPTYISWTALHC